MCLWRFSWCYSEVSKFEPLICGQTSVVNITYIMLKAFQPHTPHMFIYSQIELLVFARVEIKSRDASMNKLYPLLGPIWLRCFWRLWDSLEVVFRWRKWVITWSCFLLGLPASRSMGAWASSLRPWALCCSTLYLPEMINCVPLNHEPGWILSPLNHCLCADCTSMCTNACGDEGLA